MRVTKRLRRRALLGGLPDDLVRKILRMVGEVHIAGHPFFSEHDLASLVLLRGRGVVLVPRQLYLVSDWHTWYASSGYKLRRVIPVTKVERFGRHGGWLLRRLHAARGVAGHAGAVRSSTEANTLSVTYWSSKRIRVPWSNDMVFSRKRGQLEPFSFKYDGSMTR